MATEWFVIYRSGKGYIAARNAGQERYETYGEYHESADDCLPTVYALNGGVLKPKKRRERNEKN